MKICHLITSLSVGGAEMMLYKLLSRTDKMRFQNTVVSLIDGGPLTEQIRSLGVEVTSLGMQKGRPSIKGLYNLVQFLRQERPDIVQTWLYHADLIGLVAAKLANIPLVAWNIRSSNWDMSQYGWTSSWVVKACAKLSSQPQIVIVNTQFGQAFHAQMGYHPKKWVLIPNGIDATIFKPDLNARQSVRKELNLEPDTLLIGMIARFDPMKDHYNFLRAAGMLAQKYDSVHFVLVGRGITDKNLRIKEWIIENRLMNRVSLLGSRSDIPRLTAALDIATLSSLSEGFPNVVGEAMSCAIPCVVTDVGDAARIVGDCGTIVEPKNSDALCAGWMKLIEIGHSERRDLGTRARKRIKGQFELNKIVKIYEGHYQKLWNSMQTKK